MTSLVVRRVRSRGALKLRLVQVGPKAISEGVVKLERVRSPVLLADNKVKL